MKPACARLLFSICLLVFSAQTANADSLKITSNPSGATVEVDGVVVGTTPYEMKVPGGYLHKPSTVFGTRLGHAMVLRVCKEGYSTKEIVMTEGPMPWLAVNGAHRGDYWLLKTNHFDVVLEPISKTLTGAAVATIEGNGTLVVSSEPDGAEVYLDGKFLGNTPATLKLPIGPHTIRLKAPGHADWERAVEILKDSQLNLKAQLALAK